jgi:UDP-4-amino-4,6-dideoxy-N-acetyl-beta-L-altrosamine transaminase
MESTKFLPYGKQQITDEDIMAVTEALRSDWLTQGPTIPAFEEALTDFLGANDAIACSNGTAALHLAILALNLKKGDVVVTTPNTFPASANCVRFVGADVRFADINSRTGLIDPDSIAHLLAEDADRRIKAIIPVHFAGQPADLPNIHKMAEEHGAIVIDDACHAIGATYDHDGRTYQIGGNPHSELTVFSFHPVKHIATGEGGATATDNPELAERMRLFRNHGIIRRDFIDNDMAVNSDGIPNPWYYEMTDLGFNYRLTDIQAALGLSQLKRLPDSLKRRREIADYYRKLISGAFDDDEVRPLDDREHVSNAYHLFVVRIDFNRLGLSRAVVMNRLRSQGIGTQVHYIPVHLQPYYRENCSEGPGDLPGAELYYSEAISLPMYPDLTNKDVERVIISMQQALKKEVTSGTVVQIKNS